MKIGMLPGTGTSTASAVQVDVTGEIAGLSAASGGLAAGDVVLAEDVSASNAKVKATVTEIHGVGGITNALSAKTTPVAADLVEIEDSAASNAKKKMQQGNLLAGFIYDGTTVLDVTTITDGQYLKRSGSNITSAAASGGGATSFSYHDTRPSALGAASAHDIEFATQQPSDAGYAYTTAISGTPDFLTINSSGNPKASWAGATREGHGVIQPIDATAFVADKTITVDTDCWLHFRCPIATVNGTPDATNYTYARLALDDGTGANRVEIWFGHAYTATSGANDKSVMLVQTTTSTPAVVSTFAWSATSAVEEVLLIKDSTVYYAYARVGLTWRYIGTHTHATTMTRVRLWFLTDGAMLPGGGIFYPKFFRYGSSLPTALP